MAAQPAADLRARLVAELRIRGLLRDPRVAAAFALVPRHVFIPEVSLVDAYADRSIAIKLQHGVPISSSSQPAIMAEMLEMLALRGGERVLEIGAGSGYNAALLAEVVGAAGAVTTVDLDADLVARARAHLDDAGYAHVRTVCADGARGDPDGAPFDAVIASVGVERIPPAWIAQLRTGGRLVAPLTLHAHQKVIAFERTATGLESRAVVDAAFMMLRGPSATADTRVIALGDQTITLRVLAGNAGRVDAGALARALDARPHDAYPVRRLTIDDVWDGFAFWLAHHDDAFCRLAAQGSFGARSGVPNLLPGGEAYHGAASTLGLCADGELVVCAPLASNGVVLRCFGAPQHQLIARVQAAIAAWDDAGRPDNAALRVAVDAAGTAHVAIAARLGG